MRNSPAGISIVGTGSCETAQRVAEEIPRLKECRGHDDRSTQDGLGSLVIAGVEVNLTDSRQRFRIRRTNQRGDDELDQRVVRSADPRVREAEIGVRPRLVRIQSHTSHQWLDDTLVLQVAMLEIREPPIKSSFPGDDRDRCGDFEFAECVTAAVGVLV